MSKIALVTAASLALPRGGRPGLPGLQGGAQRLYDRPLQDAGRYADQGQLGRPGWLQTDLGGAENRAAAPTPASEGAEVVAAMACLPDDGPTGSFVDRDGPVAW
jgi:hypothetical protein